jgi:hypothetical protein
MTWRAAVVLLVFVVLLVAAGCAHQPGCGGG